MLMTSQRVATTVRFFLIIAPMSRLKESRAIVTLKYFVCGFHGRRCRSEHNSCFLRASAWAKRTVSVLLGFILVRRFWPRERYLRRFAGVACCVNRRRPELRCLRRQRPHCAIWSGPALGMFRTYPAMSNGRYYPGVPLATQADERISWAVF